MSSRKLQYSDRQVQIYDIGLPDIMDAQNFYYVPKLKILQPQILYFDKK